MKNIEIHRFIKKLVETGTEERFTLLDDKKYLWEPQTIQKFMEESIFVKSNICGHSYNITLVEFIANNKVCKRCLSTRVTSTSKSSTVMSNSLHNIQTI